MERYCLQALTDMYISLNQNLTEEFDCISKTEEVDSVNQIEHPIFKETLLHGNKCSIEMRRWQTFHLKDRSGSSSSFTVGLLNALNAYKNQFSSKEKLASEACTIEIFVFGEPIVKQDQYAAAYGMNLIGFHSNESVSVDRFYVVSINPRLNLYFSFYWQDQKCLKTTSSTNKRFSY